MAEMKGVLRVCGVRTRRPSTWLLSPALASVPHTGCDRAELQSKAWKGDETESGKEAFSPGGEAGRKHPARVQTPRLDPGLVACRSPGPGWPLAPSSGQAGRGAASAAVFMQSSWGRDIPVPLGRLDQPGFCLLMQPRFHPHSQDVTVDPPGLGQMLLWVVPRACPPGTWLSSLGLQ